MQYIFQTIKKTAYEYESVAQKGLFCSAVVIAVISGRKYDIMPQKQYAYFGFF